MKLYLLLILQLPILLKAQDVTVKKTQFSSQYDDIAPVFYNQGIVFSSNRKNHILNTYYTKGKEGKEEFLFDLFYATGDTNIGQAVKPLPKEINTLFNEGPATFSSDDNLIIVTRAMATAKKNKKGPLGLYFSKLNDGVWSMPEPFEHNSTTYNLAHPSLSKDGNTLYFTSDLPGGAGGKDIWKSEFINGEWSVPENLGSNINTPSDEIFPYADHLGNLYYSSNKQGGLGGYDIYKVALVNGYEWKVLAPVNSPQDDYALVSEDAMMSGYFCSNREGQDDIYFFESIMPVFADCKPSSLSKLCFKLSDADPSLDTLPIKYLWDFGDGMKDEGRKVEHCFPDSGDYVITMSLLDTLTGLFYPQVAEYNLTVTRNFSPLIEIDDTVKDEEGIVLSAKENVGSPFIPIKQYWFMDDVVLAQGNDVGAQLRGVGVHTIKVGEEVQVQGTDSTLKVCSYKDIVVKLDTTSVASKGEVDLYFKDLNIEMNEQQIKSIEYFSKVVAANKKILIVDYVLENNEEEYVLSETIKKYLKGIGYADSQIEIQHKPLKVKDEKNHVILKALN